ncbi:hypothetical protein B0T17DRAFT_596041 [Bombardia bombarda]|uniref:Uncharacterized protein n=1 Tax=Bombardia bombarda TaxID=252184 RepID=A0AA40CFH4_9PEZI|nr:hypothetical protein B0T17DRAFT_596041 [Bombardia bombarda]
MESLITPPNEFFLHQSCLRDAPRLLIQAMCDKRGTAITRHSGDLSACDLLDRNDSEPRRLVRTMVLSTPGNQVLTQPVGLPGGRQTGHESHVRMTEPRQKTAVLAVCRARSARQLSPIAPTLVVDGSGVQCRSLTAPYASRNYDRLDLQRKPRALANLKTQPSGRVADFRYTEPPDR